MFNRIEGNILLKKLNTKLIYSNFSDSLVFFVADLEDVNEEELIRLGHFAVSDGINMIDFKENVLDDISNMYGVKSCTPPEFINLQDFYSEIGIYDDEVTVEQIISFFDIFSDR
jgi:hypothetical protein